MKFAVGFISFYENNLEIEIIEADSWREAAIKHTGSFWDALCENAPEDFEDPEDAENEVLSIIPNTLEEAKQTAFNMDGAFDCIEIKGESV